MFRDRNDRTILLAVTALTVLLAMQPGPATRADPNGGQAVVDTPLDVNQAKTLWRWIGVRANPDAPCPPVEASGWSVSPLFELPGNPTIPPGLAPYCIYERAPGVPTGAADVMPLLDLVGGPLVRVDRDAMAVAPYATELEGLIGAPAEENFLARAGKPTPLPLTGSQPVRLAFVDTAATNAIDPESFPGTSPHGFSLINMANELLCDEGGGCLADVTSQLALAYVWPAPGCPQFNPRVNNPDCRNEVDGGRVGLLGDLAQAAYREVDDWLDTAPPGQRLVLNLSLGWLPEFGGAEPPGSMPVPVQAVLRALQYASCEGALVLAASGNAKNGPDQPVGPLYPGGWERLSAPRAGACNTMLGMPPDPGIFPPPPDRRSVVLAAGGVRNNDEPLFNARPGGEPRAVAFADHAVTQAPASPDGRTSVMTGTSVAAAVVSAAAAAAWYYQPNLPPYEVLEQVYTSGTALGRSAEFCVRGTPANPCPFAGLLVRRVSLCAAADAACAGGGAFCPPAGALACPPTGPVDLSAVDLTAFEASAEPLDLGPLTDVTSDPACVDETILYTGSEPTNPCPHQQYHGVWAETWLGPQPGSHPCAGCVVDYSAGGLLYLEIGDEIDGVLADPSLKCGDTVYALPLSGPFVSGYKAVVSDVPCDGQTPVELSFTVDDERSTTSPIFNLDF
jgi:hypothetical protein